MQPQRPRSAVIIVIAACLLYQNCAPAFVPARLRSESQLSTSFGTKTTPLSMRLLSNEEYSYSVTDLTGIVVEPDLISNWTPTPQAFGFDTNARSEVDSKMVEDRIATAETIASSAVESEEFMKCQANDDSAWIACAESIIISMAERAYRRPLNADELAAFRSSLSQNSPEWAKAFGNATGYLDNVGSDLVVSGWALDQEWEDRGVELHFYIDGQAGTGRFVGSTWTGHKRPDVNSVMQVKGDHGYVFQLPTELADGRLHSLFVHAIDGKRNPLLQGSGRFFTLASPVQKVEIRRPPPLYIKEEIRSAVAQILVSPDFLFKTELASTGTSRPLDDFEIAARLALFFAKSVPDQQLWSLAIQGALRSRTTLEQEVDRLIETYSDRFIESFTGQWLGHRRLLKMNSSASKELLAAFRTEAKLVFKEVLLKDLPVTTLLAPGFTFANKLLAENYGLPFTGSDPTQFIRIEQAQRGGVLTQGSMAALTSTSDNGLTPVIRRGKWVLDTLLCEEVPAPSPDLFQLIENAKKSINPQDPVHVQLEIHRKQGTACITCHQKMDPIGLGLESYDAFGRWRSTYSNGAQVMAQGRLFGRDFTGPMELSTLLSGRSDFTQCIERKILQYASLIPSEANGAKSVQELKRTGQPRSLRDIFVDLVTSDAFLTTGAKSP